MLPHQLKLKWHPADQLPARWQIWLVAPAGQPAATHRSLTGSQRTRSVLRRDSPSSCPALVEPVREVVTPLVHQSAAVWQQAARQNLTDSPSQPCLNASPRTYEFNFCGWALSLSLEPFLGDVAGLCSTNLSIYVVATVAVRHCDSANSSFIRPIGAGAREMDNDAIVSLPRIGCPVSSHNWRFFLETFKI